MKNLSLNDDDGDVDHNHDEVFVVDDENNDEGFVYMILIFQILLE